MTAVVPLVGREAELAALLGAAGVAGESSARAVLVAGDAGIGKTRLLRELTARAVAAGHHVLVGHCLDLGDAVIPHQPFAEALARLEAGARDALLAAQPALAPLVEGGVDVADRGRLFAAVVAGLDVLAAQAPVLLVVEDVHWADASTRHLLGHVLARPGRADVRVVASVRTDDLDRRHPLRPVLAEWLRLPGVTRLDLAPLPDHDVDALLRARSATALDPEAVDDIVHRAAGNAFYAEELLAAGRAGGSVPAAGGGRAARRAAIVRRLGADRPRARGAGARRPGPQQRRDRGPAVHQRQDRVGARLEHPGQARGVQPHRGGRDRPPARAGRAGPVVTRE